MKLFRSLAIALAAVAPAGFAAAQTTLEAPLGEYQPYFVDSGPKANAEGQARVVHQEIVRIPNANWVRLYFGDVQLARGSSLRVTSVLDNEVQELDWPTLRMWNHSTAYFNGDTVIVELIAAPNSAGNRLIIQDVGVEIGATLDRGGCGICGFDDRVPSNILSAGRLMPVGCSATIYNEDSCIVTAGHCLDGGDADVIQFNVPNSNGNCSTNNPPVADQFPLLAQQFANGGVGNDWGAASVGTNNLGQTPYERYGELRPLATNPANNGQTAQIWGYGVDEQCNRSQTQQFHQGPIVSVTGSYYLFSIEATFGNSGSGLIEGGEVVGVVSHCSTNCSPQQNVATRIDLPAFVAARAAVCSGVGLENDDCEDAIPFNDGLGDGVIPFSTIGATTDGPVNPADTCNDFGENQTHHDIWYTYQASCTGDVTITTCDDIHGAGDPTYDTDLVVYGPYNAIGDINCNNLDFLACNDDVAGLGCGDNPPYSSAIEIAVNQGEYYLVRVGGWADGEQGTGFLEIECAGVSAGACCFGNGDCIEVTASQCAAQGGQYFGDGTTCDDVSCTPDVGACCLPNGNCLPLVSEAACNDLGGSWNGPDTLCGDVECPQPSGACCLQDGSCIELEEAECNNLGGKYFGDFSTCGDVECSLPTGACCLPDGSCLEVDDLTCKKLAGLYFGDGTACGDVDCPQPTGACCLEDGTCTQTTLDDCVNLNGDYQGDGVDCFDVDCPSPCDDSCAADIYPKGDPCDGDGTVNVDDLLKLLGSWGECEDCNADIYPIGKPDGEVNVDDLLTLLASWGDCPGLISCDVGFSCGQDLVNCEGTPNPDCFCLTGMGGEPVCCDVTISSCSKLQECASGPCPEGLICVIDTCCADPICLPPCEAGVGSGGAAPELKPGTRTIRGIVRQND